MEPLQSNLKNLRVRRGYTQLELAQKLGVKKNNVSNWENGVSKPSLAALLKIANVLRVKIDDLLTNEDIVQEHGTPQVQECRPNYVDLSEKSVDPFRKISLNTIPCITSDVLPEYAAGRLEKVPFEITSPGTVPGGCAFQVPNTAMDPHFNRGDYLLCRRIPHSRPVYPNTFYFIILSGSDGTPCYLTQEHGNYTVYFSNYQEFPASTLYPHEIKEIWQPMYMITSLYPLVNPV